MWPLPTHASSAASADGRLRRLRQPAAQSVEASADACRNGWSAQSTGAGPSPSTTRLAATHPTFPSAWILTQPPSALATGIVMPHAALYSPAASQEGATRTDAPNG